MMNRPPHCDSPPDYTSEAGDPDFVSPPLFRVRHPKALSVPEPRYVYYRLYALDGMLRCKNPGSQQTPFIGRIKSTSVPPPYTVASLKRALVQAEGLPDPEGELTSLFETRDARTPMAKNASADIFTGSLGATAQTPVALVFLRNPTVPLQAVSGDRVEDGGDKMLPPVYYRVYNRGGEEKSSRCFDASEPALGRINRESIAPPCNALSVKRCIARAEGKPIYEFADLFIDVSAVAAQPSSAVVDDRSGSTKENPLLIVQPERRPGLYNRPLLVVALPTQMPRCNLYQPHEGYAYPSQWLSVKPGDIVCTDGKVRLWGLQGGATHSAYTAVDNIGNTGVVSADATHSKLLDEPPTSSCNIQ
ncbi:hypothetical protein C8F01DRAFT_1177040 [Mycena amicta]|nr:hypothetical protein C8F01DRAFT_1177040 [Mycena amicta]